MERKILREEGKLCGNRKIWPANNEHMEKHREKMKEEEEKRKARMMSNVSVLVVGAVEMLIAFPTKMAHPPCKNPHGNKSAEARCWQLTITSSLRDSNVPHCCPKAPFGAQQKGASMRFAVHLV